MDNIQRILNQFRTELDDIAPCTTWAVTATAGNSRKCDIYVLASPHTAKKLAIKIYRPGMVSDRAPKAQYKAMLRAHGKLACPKAYGFLPDDRAILMDWIEGPRFRSVLWQQILHPSKRLALVEQTGRWLRQLHDLSSPQTEPFDGGKMIAKLHIQLTKHEAAAKALGLDEVFNASLKTLEQLAPVIDADIPHSLLHGDFTPSNLLVKNDTILGIDIWGARRAPIYEDAARMLAYLSVTSPFSLSPRPLGADSALMNAFIDGYGKDQINPEEPAWRFTLLYQQLRRWIVYQNRLKQQTIPLVPFWLVSRSKKNAGQNHAWLAPRLSEA